MKKILILVLLINTKLFCQIPFDEDMPSWDHPPKKYNSVIVPAEFKSDNLVIINDNVLFDLTGYKTRSLQRTVLLKIMNEEGLKKFGAFPLPESFDIAQNSELIQQGRRSKIKMPYIESYQVDYFIARVIKPNGKVLTLKPDKIYTTVRWIKPTGEYADDNPVTFLLKGLAVGDVVEYSYKATYKPSYGENILCLSSPISKANVEYSFKYIALPENINYKFLFTSNIPDSCVTYTYEAKEKEFTFITEKITLQNLQRVNYFIHAFTSQQLPQVYFNINYSIRLYRNSYYSIADIPDFRWTHFQDDKDKRNWHTKFPDDIRKFVATMPVFENDSNSFKFMKAFNDTLNSFKYYSANYMYYNDPRLYSLYSTDHLFKRRLSEMNLLHIYESILDEKDVFYFITNLQDKRLGEHNPLVRNRVYENIILAIPVKNSFVYLVPRYSGSKLFLNELPFYYEGAVAALFPADFDRKKYTNPGNNFRFIKTYRGTSNENVRIENALVTINTDSANCRLNIKESLAGQFSTIIRPLYLKELIDSSINPVYFKRCVDKPNASDKKTVLLSKSEEYPFKFVFNCSEKIALKKAGEIDLENWFSFLFNRDFISEKPTHDFYFDFVFSDCYNFVFKFGKPVTITNMDELNNSIDNENFELISSFKKQENDYLLSVTAIVKKNKLPKENAMQLLEFVAALEKINSYKIRYTE